MAHQTIVQVVVSYLPYLCDVMDTLMENEGWQDSYQHRFKLSAVLYDVARACFKLGREYEKRKVRNDQVLGPA